jgi:hypothetical protein
MRALACLVLFVGLVAVTGCNTMTMTYDERKGVYQEVLDSDMRQLAEDWDHVWLADRQYRLTKWQLR